MKDSYLKFKEYTQERIGVMNPFGIIGLMLDYKIEYLTHGVLVPDYYKYRFFEKKRSGRDAFPAGKKRIDFANRFNKKEDCRIFDEKSLFIEKYKNFLGRDALIIEGSTYEDFQEFYANNPYLAFAI